jgi:6-phosphogluconolactonase
LYEQEIRAVFRGQGTCGVPEFDIVLLGLGIDGHTASLFAHDAALEERERLVLPVHAPAGYEPRERITLTLPAISNAQRVIFLVSGPQKAAVLRAIFDQRRKTAAACPAARVRCRREIIWFISRQ